MTALWHWLQSNPHRWLRWTRIFTSFALVQLVVQLLNATAGFLLIRSLDKPHYAWFTIANGMSATLSVLADAGIAAAVTALGGGVWQDKKALSDLVAAALRLRRQLAFIAIALVAPLSLWLLRRNGTSWSEALLLTGIVLVPVLQISTTAILSVVNRLHSRTRQLQIADLAPALTRALLTLGLVAVGGITPFTAMMASVLALGLQFGLVKHQVSRLLKSVPTQEGIQAFTRKLSPLVRKFYPNALFTSVQGQLSIWLISFFASTSEVADFGALTRFAILFAMVGAPISQWLVPAFARAETPRRMAVLLTGSAALVTTMTGGLLVAAWLAPDWLLWLLGPAYAQLQQELLWVLGVLGINSLMQTVWGFNMSRGWINTISLNIPLVLATQAITLCFVSVNTLSGVALLGIIVALVQCVHATWIAVSQLRKLSLSSHSPCPCP